MPVKQTFCDPNWFVKELNPDIAEWLKPVENDNTRVFCIPCKKTIELSNMGIRAVKSHTAGLKHKRNCDNVHFSDAFFLQWINRPSGRGVLLNIFAHSLT